MEYKPYGYQQIATEYILDHAACGLFLDTGLGKTVTFSSIERRGRVLIEGCCAKCGAEVARLCD